ncbi:MAG: hypothetical protein HY074_14960, partial [Deltaproteobacteria bacterium]|nr:hypothetical protein [Deltaproteobacteria bacterium]
GLWVVVPECGALPETLNGFENAVCIATDAFHPAYIASVCQERLKAPPKPVSDIFVARWTDEARWRALHEKLLFQVAMGRIDKNS